MNSKSVLEAIEMKKHDSGKSKAARIGVGEQTYVREGRSGKWYRVSKTRCLRNGKDVLRILKGDKYRELIERLERIAERQEQERVLFLTMKEMVAAGRKSLDEKYHPDRGGTHELFLNDVAKDILDNLIEAANPYTTFLEWFGVRQADGTYKPKGESQ